MMQAEAGRPSRRRGRKPIKCALARVEELARELPTQRDIATRLGMGLSTLNKKLKSSASLRRAYERGRGIRAERVSKAAADAARLRASAARRGWESLEDGGVDAGLYLLALVTPRGVTLSQGEIAEVCGCSRTLIYLIEKEALRKLKRALEGSGVGEDFLRVSNAG